ncbi:MAG: hypothetical protein OEM91_07940 [Hyphomicrobiales bacterium]|nr:hypothetical protein [Hyphomicrobiales bacterium]
MSTTRSPSRKERATKRAGAGTIALILAAPGGRNLADSNLALAEHATALSAEMDWAFVGHGVLHGEPSLDAIVEMALTKGVDEIVIYPFSMSECHFVTRALPECVAAAGATNRATILPPLGRDPGLAAVMMDEALEAAGQARFDPATTRLLIAGQGSRSEPTLVNAVADIAGAVNAMGRFKIVEPAYLERPPFLFNTLASEKIATIVAGFFADKGTHSMHDIPSAIEESGARAVYAGPVGACAAVRHLIAEATRRHTLNAG